MKLKTTTNLAYLEPTGAFAPKPFISPCASRCRGIVLSTKRSREAFREMLRDSIDYDDMRVMSTESLARVADPETVNKFRQDIYHQQSKQIDRLSRRTGVDDDMEKYRSTKGDYSIDMREFALSDNVALIYFNCYGENFEGGPIIDNVEDGWTCPGCKLKYKLSLKGLPDRCIRCGWQSPLGRLKKDGFLRR